MNSMTRRKFLAGSAVVAGGVLAPRWSFAKASTPDKPNILWITSEDNSISWVSCYGGVNTKTPAIDQLAKEGFRYTHCFDNAAVCAPTRSCWITGMYAISNGTQPMRSRNNIPHDKIPYYPDLLKKAGYHVTNGGKTDYNIGGRDDSDCWSQKGAAKKGGKKKRGRRRGRYGWQNCPENQPFFAIVNIGDSHESRAHGRGNGGKDPSKMTLASYHPDLPVIRENYAKYASAVERMDGVVKRTVAQLKADKLYEDTIIVYNSDHGGVMARSKRFVYSSGIHCPLVVRIPEKWKQFYPADKPGSTVDRIVSFVDMPKTWVSLAGAKIPDTFQGTVFLGKGTEPEPKYHLGFRERADERYDCVRMIRGKQYAYYKNYMPYAPAGQHLAYLWKAPATPAWEKHHKEGKTNEITGRFFRPRVSEEFYDTVDDFDNVKNLIDDPKHAKKIAELKAALRAKQLELFDSGLIPETMRVRRAAANKMTIYEMVRNEKLYPLAKYLDAADLALVRDKKNLATFVKRLSDADECIRYWSIVGLLLLDKNAADAEAAIAKAMGDEAEEVKMLAAWSLVKIGKTKEPLACLSEMLKGCKCAQLLYNMLDWMGPPAFPLVKKALKAGVGKRGKYGTGILAHIAEVNGL